MPLYYDGWYSPYEVVLKGSSETYAQKQHVESGHVGKVVIATTFIYLFIFVLELSLVML